MAERRADVAIYGATADGVIATVAAALAVRDGGGVHRLDIAALRRRLADRGQVLAAG